MEKRKCSKILVGFLILVTLGMKMKKTMIDEKNEIYDACNCLRGAMHHLLDSTGFAR